MSVEVKADTRAFDSAMEALTDSTRTFGKVFVSTMSSAIRSGKGFDDFLRNLGRRFSDLALQRALKPLEDLFGNGLNSVIGGVFQIPDAGKGAAFSGGGVVPFARGGVVSSPAVFGFGNRLGVMGEAGPEAIMPLRRGSDGRLGVAVNGGAAGTPNIVFNVQTNDAASFRKSEGQITTMLARAVGRGRRGL